MHSRNIIHYFKAENEEIIFMSTYTAKRVDSLYYRASTQHTIRHGRKFLQYIVCNFFQSEEVITFFLYLF